MKNFTVLSIFILTATLFSCKDNIELEKGQLISPGLYSLNTGTSFYWCNPKNLEECIGASEKFMPSIIRFPGGLDANFYHMDGKGYGYKRPPEGDSKESDTPKDSLRMPKGSIENRSGSNEILKISKDAIGSKDALAKDSKESGTGDSDEDYFSQSDDDDKNCFNIKDAFHFGNKKYPTFQDPRDKKYPRDENVIENVIQFCKKTNAKILFTCNIIDATYAENKKVMDRLISEGISIAGVEIGNEMYLPKFKCLKYGSVEKYIDTAKWYSENLKKDFPGLKIAVIAAPPLMKAIPKKIVEYYRSWNEALKKETFFDAYIVHHYVKDKTCSCDNDFTNAQTRSTAFECYNNVLKKELEYWFQDGIKYYLDLFPGKKMWLTEWNSHISLHCFGNTQADNLYFAKYQNELTSKYAEKIEFATFHNWLGNGKHFPIISLSKNVFEQRSSSPVFEMFKPIFSERETYTVSSPSTMTQALPVGVTSYVYYQPSNKGGKGKLLVMLVNFSDKKENIQFPSKSLAIDNVSFDPKGGKFTTIYSESLSASLAKAGFGKQVEPLQVKNGALLSPYVIEKNSISLITMETTEQ